MSYGTRCITRLWEIFITNYINVECDWNTLFTVIGVNIYILFLVIRYTGPSLSVLHSLDPIRCSDCDTSREETVIRLDERECYFTSRDFPIYCFPTVYRKSMGSDVTPYWGFFWCLIVLGLSSLGLHLFKIWIVITVSTPISDGIYRTEYRSS